MLRAYVVILIVYGAFVVHGCAGVDQPDRDVAPKAVAKELKGTKDELWIEKERLRLENVELQRQIDVLSTENERIVREYENRMDRSKTLNQLLNKEIEELKDENRTVASENRLLKRKLSQLQARKEPIAHEQTASKVNIRSLKIKVISGDGDLRSAHVMAEKLRKMGYEAKAIDLASQSRFSRDTVFFASKSQREAKQLVSRLEGNAVLKPLSWPSVFDLIIVTGKNP
jgi:FtsZ-binding cell division protein ZapB